jgi:hypothetical protein
LELTEILDTKKQNMLSASGLADGWQGRNLQLAIRHQAMNVWEVRKSDPSYREDEEELIMQLHQYGSAYRRRDDKEYVARFRVHADKRVTLQKKVETSCPSVEVIVPRHGPYIFEARIAAVLGDANMGYAECSCIGGNFHYSSPGVCPRGIEYQIVDLTHTTTTTT